VIVVLLTNPANGDTFEVRTLTGMPKREGPMDYGLYVWTSYHSSDDLPGKSTPCLWGPMDAFGFSSFLTREASEVCDRVRRGWTLQDLPD
jgi:hypothetical protein